MTIAFISDLHLTPDRPHSTALFNSFIGDASKHLDQLYILGDLFEYWIGDDGAGSLGHDCVEQALARTVDRGVDVFFLHGNRDFLVGDVFAARSGCQLLPDPVLIEPDGLKILLTHGDALCTDDIDHQAARSEMLTAEWKKAFLAKPLSERAAAANALRSESESGKQSKSMEIMDVNQDAVAGLMTEWSVDILIHGHTHKPAAHEFIRDGRLMRRYVLGDWYEQKSSILIDDGRLTLRR